MRLLLDLLEVRMMERATHQADREAISLRRICAEMFEGEKELCEAVNFTVSPDPENLVKTGVKRYLELGEKYEGGKEKNPTIAAANYWNAGRVAMFNGDVELARKCFLKCAELNPDSPYVKHFTFYKKKENAEKAMKVAQEYYTKMGQKTR
jgi:tetratricopeptide (TPR) repeat protein